jgi:hypothetical protein
VIPGTIRAARSAADQERASESGDAAAARPLASTSLWVATAMVCPPAFKRGNSFSVAPSTRTSAGRKPACDRGSQALRRNFGALHGQNAAQFAAQPQHDLTIYQHFAGK